MRVAILRPVLVLSLGSAAVLAAQQPAPVSGPTKQLQPADLKAWKSIRSSVLSSDGKWFAYVLAPNEGDANVIIRSTGTDNKEFTFPIGSSDAAGRGGGGGRGGAAPDAGGGPLSISADSRWVAFTVYPPTASGRGGRGGAGRGGRGGGGGGAQTTDGTAQTPAPQNKLAVVNLATGEKKEFDRVRRYAFNGDKPTWLAIQAPAEAPAAPAGNATNGAARGGAGAAGGNATAGRAEGTDLLLYNLANGEAVNVGNVAEFGFDDSGDWLAYTIDARDAIGNGVQLRNMKTDVVRPIDSDRALYRHLVWSDSLDALAVLRGRIDSTARDTVYSVVAFTNVSAPAVKKTVFDASQHAEFPKDMAIAVDRAPRLTEDLSAVYFGIHEAKKPSDRLLAGRGSSVIQAGAPGMGGTNNQPRVNEATEENPSLILWNVKDPRLQSQQIVQEAQDRAFNYLSEYRIADNKFVQLADESLRNVAVAPHDHFAIGTDTRDYDNNASYTGRSYEDDYTIDLRTGKRDLALKKHRPAVRVPSPERQGRVVLGRRRQLLGARSRDRRQAEHHEGDGRELLEHRGRSQLSGSAAARAVRLDERRRVGAPLRRLGRLEGADDGHRIGGEPHGERQARSDPVQPRLRVRARRDDRRGGGRGGRGGRGGGGASLGIDVSQPLYVGTYGEWTKKAGLSRVDPGTPGAKSLVWDDASFDFQKARDADVYLYTRQTSRDFPNYFVANTGLQRRTPDSTRRESSAEGFCLDERRAPDQLHERQGRQAAGRALPAGELRAGQEVSAARHHLREAVEPREHVRVAERDQHAEPQPVHEPRLRGARSRHRVSGQRSGHVGGVVRDPRREGGDRHRHDRFVERRTLGPLVGRLPDGVPRHADEHLQGGDRRRAAHQHGEHVRIGLLEHRQLRRVDLRGRARAASRATSSRTTTRTSATRRSSTPRR